MDNFSGYRYPLLDRNQYLAQLRHAQQSAGLAINQGIYQPELSISSQSLPSLLPNSVNMSTLTYDPLETFAQINPLNIETHESLNFEINIPGISLTPMTGTQVIEKVKSSTNDVIARFLPCVDFLVICQQELRSGLANALRKKQTGRAGYRDNLTPHQFYRQYFEPLPNRFAKKNKHIIPQPHLSVAIDEITKLLLDAKKNANFGCESVKNAFLGGMRDGESWGLRRWLSKNGGALHICSDLENIFQALQSLDRDSENTQKLASFIRPIAKKTHDRLTGDIPSAYQEVSSAHPYLPFFHRLESALKSLSNFDPTDDDVIIIDDEEEIQVAKQKAANKTKRNSSAVFEYDASANKKLKSVNATSTEAQTQNRQQPNWNSGYNLPNIDAPGTNSEEIDDDESDCEIICVTNTDKGATSLKPSVQPTNPIMFESFLQPPPANDLPNLDFESFDDTDITKGWRCSQCTFLNSSSSNKCIMCNDDDAEAAKRASATNPLNAQFTESQPESIVESCAVLIDAIALEYEQGRGYRPEFLHYFQNEMFWNRPMNFAYALRLFSSLMKNSSGHPLIEPFKSNAEELKKALAHPLCFKDIVNALILSEENTTIHRNFNGRGKLGVSLNWNMFHGRDLLEAVDLVLLNGLVFYGKEKSPVKASLTKMRKNFWDSIYSKMGSAQDRASTPTKRGVQSGFVVNKKKLNGR